MKLSPRLELILRNYFTPPEKFRQELYRLDKNEIIESLTYVLKMYSNDLNSSTLRELATLLIAGYERIEGKLGYNGLTAEGRYCEVKPKNIRSNSNEKLNGGGNFSDFTYERLEKYLNDNVMMLVSGFVDGQLIYILEFPFKCISNEIKRQLDRYFKDKKRKRGEYLRSATFSFKHYKNCPSLRVIYKTDKIAQFGRFITKELFKYLLER